MPNAWIALLLLSAGFAGCIGTVPAEDTATPLSPQEDGAPADTASTTDEARAALDYEGCLELTGTYAVPADAWRDSMPDGFELVTLDPAGQLAVEVHPAYRCEGQQATTVAESWASVVVDPPRAWASADASLGHLLPIGAMTTDPDSLEAFTAWGFDMVELGEGTVETVGPAPVSLARASFTGSQTGITYEQTGLAQGLPATQDGGGARVFAVQENVVVGAMDVSWPDHDAVATGQATRTLVGAGFPFPPAVYPGLAELHLPEGHDLSFRAVELGPLGADEGPNEASPNSPSSVG